MTSQTLESIELERQADELLARLPHDPERPFYTERQLARHGSRLTIERVLTRHPPMQPLRDELQFLLSVTKLDKENRRFMRFWLNGWSQREIADALNISQQFVSQRLGTAIRACFDMTPISF